MVSNKKQKIMAEVKKTKGVIAILTGGGDVPGLNPAIRAVTIRANREGFKVIGLRRGWAGITELIRDNKADNSNCYQILTDDDSEQSRPYRRNISSYLPYKTKPYDKRKCP